MRKSNKTFIYVFAALVILYSAVLVFNHLNAWLGIAIAVGVIIFVINNLFKNIKP